MCVYIDCVCVGYSIGYDSVDSDRSIDISEVDITQSNNNQQQLKKKKKKRKMYHVSM